MADTDYYKALGVSRTATDDEIRRAYRALARKHHPDVAKGPEAEARFKEISAAYEVLKDPEKRAAYDNPQAQRDFGGAPEWEGGYGFAHPGAGGMHGFEDIFEQFRDPGRRASGFGGGMAFADQHARIEIPLSDAYSGTTHKLSLQVPQITPEGQVTLTERTIAVTIPKGVIEGQNIRLRGQGVSRGDGAGAGDLYLEVHFAPHPVYRPEGRDLHLELPVTPWEAALGGRITLPTPDGKVDLKIPKNARSGQKLRLKGKGLPTAPPGDIYATLRIVNPKVTSDAEASLFEKMAREMSFNPRAAMGG